MSEERTGPADRDSLDKRPPVDAPSWVSDAWSCVVETALASRADKDRIIAARRNGGTRTGMRRPPAV